jgi:hypothetical protein
MSVFKKSKKLITNPPFKSFAQDALSNHAKENSYNPLHSLPIREEFVDSDYIVLHTAIELGRDVSHVSMITFNDKRLAEHPSVLIVHVARAIHIIKVSDADALTLQTLQGEENGTFAINLLNARHAAAVARAA